MNSERCARPACAGWAVAWLAYDYDAQCAWLDDQPSDESERAGRWPLCARHADSLRVPRGWFSVDRRADRAEPPEAGADEQRPAGRGRRRPAPGPSGPSVTAIL